MKSVHAFSGLVVWCLLAVGVGASDIASDTASNAPYANGWQTGDNGGVGLGPWQLGASTQLGGSQAGAFIGSSTNNAWGTSPGIDSYPQRLSWGLYANGGATAVAFRAFNGGSLAVGQSLQLDIDSGFIDSGMRVGLVLRHGNATGGAWDLRSGAQYELSYVGGDPSNSYRIIDSSGTRHIGLPFTGTGLHMQFTLTSSSVYSCRVWNISTGLSVTNTGTFLASLDSLAFYNASAGPGPSHDVFFNNIMVTGPVGVVTKTWYVKTTGSDAGLGASWATAKQTIQGAVNVAQPGDTVLVSNGVYASNGWAGSDLITNRVALNIPLWVRSVNGPNMTTILVSSATSPVSMRCALVGSGASLSGFTLAQRMAGTESICTGGGVLSNCVIRGY